MFPTGPHHSAESRISASVAESKGSKLCAPRTHTREDVCAHVRMCVHMGVLRLPAHM